MVKWLMTGPFPQLKRKSSSEEGKSHKQKGGLWTIPKRWTEISKIYIDKWINRRKRVWNLARWQAGLKAILVAVVGGWWEGEGGCPLNNNHCYSSKTFPHPLAVFFLTQAFICSVNRTALAKRLEDIISLLASVIQLCLICTLWFKKFESKTPIQPAFILSI